jgi:hypothetical protein
MRLVSWNAGVFSNGFWLDGEIDRKVFAGKYLCHPDDELRRDIDFSARGTDCIRHGRCFYLSPIKLSARQWQTGTKFTLVSSLNREEWFYD